MQTWKFNKSYTNHCVVVQKTAYQEYLLSTQNIQF